MTTTSLKNIHIYVRVK